MDTHRINELSIHVEVSKLAILYIRMVGLGNHGLRPQNDQYWQFTRHKYGFKFGQ